MTADQIFSIANTLALLSWVVLSVAPRWKWTLRITGIAVPLVLAVLYVAVLATHWGSGGDFKSLTGVEKLFSNRWLLLGGWVHYLAFDLFIGSWEVRDSRRRGLPHWAVIPCLIVTFLFGPAGLLLYFVLRTLRSGSRASEASID